MKKLESLKKVELIDIILRKDEVEKELRQQIKDIQFDVDQVLEHSTETQKQLNVALENYQNSREMYDKDMSKLSNTLESKDALYRQNLKQLSDRKDKTIASLRDLLEEEAKDAKHYKEMAVLFGFSATILAFTLVCHLWFC